MSHEKSLELNPENSNAWGNVVLVEEMKSTTRKEGLTYEIKI